MDQNDNNNNNGACEEVKTNDQPKEEQLRVERMTPGVVMESLDNQEVTSSLTLSADNGVTGMDVDAAGVPPVMEPKSEVSEAPAVKENGESDDDTDSSSDSDSESSSSSCDSSGSDTEENLEPEREWTIEERHKIWAVTNVLPEEKMGHVVEIVRSHESQVKGCRPDEIDIDFLVLSSATLRQLKKYVDTLGEPSSATNYGFSHAANVPERGSAEAEPSVVMSPSPAQAEPSVKRNVEAMVRDPVIVSKKAAAISSSRGSGFQIKKGVKGGARVTAPLMKNTSTKRDLQVCSKIVKELLGKKHYAYAYPFHKPVDPQSCGAYNYYEIIKKPMDLGTIHANLTKGVYKRLPEFLADMRLMFSNCYTYNEADHEVVAMAKKLQKVFDAKCAKMLIAQRGSKRKSVTDEDSDSESEAEISEPDEERSNKSIKLKEDFNVKQGEIKLSADRSGKKSDGGTVKETTKKPEASFMGLSSGQATGEPPAKKTKVSKTKKGEVLEKIGHIENCFQDFNKIFRKMVREVKDVKSRVIEMDG